MVLSLMSPLPVCCCPQACAFSPSRSFSDLQRLNWVQILDHSLVWWTKMVLNLTQSHSALSLALFCYTHSVTAGRDLPSMLFGHHLRQLIREGAAFSLGPSSQTVLIVITLAYPDLAISWFIECLAIPLFAKFAEICESPYFTHSCYVSCR